MLQNILLRTQLDRILADIALYRWQEAEKHSHDSLEWTMDLTISDDLGQFVDLCLGGHVHILISYADNHTTQDGGIRLEEREK